MVATGAWDGRGEELGWRPGGLRAVRVRDGADGGRSSGRGGIEIRRGDEGEFANEKKTFSRRKKGGGNSADFLRAATGKSGGQESGKGNLARKKIKRSCCVNYLRIKRYSVNFPSKKFFLIYLNKKLSQALEKKSFISSLCAPFFVAKREAFRACGSLRKPARPKHKDGKEQRSVSAGGEAAQWKFIGVHRNGTGR